MSGFADGIRAGMALGGALRQAWRDNKRDDEIAKVNDEKVEDLGIQPPKNMDGTQTVDKSVMFMGKTYDKKPDDGAISEARMNAKAGILEKYGDIQGADRLRSNARQDKLATLQIGSAERQAKRDKQADDDEAKIRAVDDEVAAWTQTRLKNPDGTMRDMTPDDHLESSQYRVAKLVGAGQLKAANALAKDNFQMAGQKIQMQTAERNEALSRVGAQVAAGDLSGLGDFYARYIPDGAKVKNITQDPKTGAISIERESLDGRPLSPTKFKNRDEVLAGLKTFQDPMALYNFSMNEFQRGLQDRQVRNQERQIGNSERRLDQAESEKKERANAAVSLFKQQNPNAKPEEIEAVRTGVMPAVGEKGQVAEVKLAQALVLAGAAPDMKSALNMALTKKSDSPASVYLDLMKPQNGIPPKEADVAPIMESVYGANWRDQVKPARGGAPASGPQPGAVVNGFRFKGGDPKVQANWEPVK